MKILNVMTLFGGLALDAVPTPSPSPMSIEPLVFAVGSHNVITDTLPVALTDISAAIDHSVWFSNGHIEAVPPVGPDGISLGKTTSPQFCHIRGHTNLRHPVIFDFEATSHILPITAGSSATIEFLGDSTKVIASRSIQAGQSSNSSTAEVVIATNLLGISVRADPDGSATLILDHDHGSLREAAMVATTILIAAYLSILAGKLRKPLSPQGDEKRDQSSVLLQEQHEEERQDLYQPDYPKPLLQTQTEEENQDSHQLNYADALLQNQRDGERRGDQDDLAAKRILTLGDSSVSTKEDKSPKPSELPWHLLALDGPLCALSVIFANGGHAGDIAWAYTRNTSVLIISAVGIGLALLESQRDNKNRRRLVEPALITALQAPFSGRTGVLAQTLCGIAVAAVAVRDLKPGDIKKIAGIFAISVVSWMSPLLIMVGVQDALQTANLGTNYPIALALSLAVAALFLTQGPS